MLPQEFIRLKRDGQKLPPKAIAEFVSGFTDERVTEGQIAAFAMAVWFNGMDRDETVA
jgi:thymidine phosphorylase